MLYHPNGDIASFNHGSTATGIEHGTTRNERGLPLRATDTGGVRDDQYGYDASGNVTAILDLLPSNVGSRAMSYDGLDRLETASAPNLWGSATYGYDALDNLTGTTITGGITARATVHNINATTNRLDSITGGPPGFNVSYGYDVRGNVTQRNGQVFEYDLGNRLKRAVGKATYTYDGFRRRVSVVGTDGVTRVQVYAQDGKLLYVAPSGGTATKYVYLRNHVLAEVTGATVTYDHTDALGSPVAQTNAAGAVLSRTRYEPYGYMVAGTPRTIGFTGHVNDNDTTLVYMQQRYYDAFAGRFLGVDPVVTDADTGGSFNRYSYARNSPYAYIDPDGRDVIGYLVKLLDNGGKVVLRALDKAEAVSARKAGQNVQATSKSNAKQIEIAARNGKKDGILQHKGHELKNGSTGDPHFQTEGVTGHTFWGGETGLASVDLLETLLIPLLATPSALAPGTLYGPGTPYKDSEAYEESLRKRDAERNKEDEIIRSQTEQDRH